MLIFEAARYVLNQLMKEEMSNTNEKVENEQDQVQEKDRVRDQDPEEVLDAADRKETDDAGPSDTDTDTDTDPAYDNLEPEELKKILVKRDRQIKELEEAAAAARESQLRKAAELENVKKRFQRERMQLFETARAKALEDFLPINDDLRRTLKAFDESEVNDSIMDGVSMVASKFEEVLGKYGVERIDEEMVPFDVDLHDAMMSQKPEDDDIESDIVLKVLENGYRMGDRTIRHAKVIVSE